MAAAGVLKRISSMGDDSLEKRDCRRREYQGRRMTRDELIAEYARQAALGQFQGNTVLRYERHLQKLIWHHAARSILDYGSGHGMAWSGGLQQRLGLEHVRRYDPAIPEFADKIKGAFDGVVCIDVLEHLLPEDVPPTVATLFNHAAKFVFATVCCRPAKKFIAPHVNMHTTLRPMPWWNKVFERTAAGRTYVLLQTP